MDITSLTPPNNKEAEEAVLGSIFLDPSVLPDIIEEIRWEDFYYEKNRIIFKCMEDLFDRGIPVDTVSVLENLRQSKTPRENRRRRNDYLLSSNSTHYS